MADASEAGQMSLRKWICSRR